jgi:hypothetical protein
VKTQLQLINIVIIIIIIIIISFMQAIYTYIPETNYHSYQPLHRSTELYHYYYYYLIADDLLPKINVTDPRIQDVLTGQQQALQILTTAKS